MSDGSLHPLASSYGYPCDINLVYKVKCELMQNETIGYVNVINIERAKGEKLNAGFTLM